MLLLFILTWNNGAFWPFGVTFSKMFIAVMGQSGLKPNEGIFMILTWSLVCKVFDHLIRTWRPRETRKMSLRANCCNGEKAFIKGPSWICVK